MTRVSSGTPSSQPDFQYGDMRINLERRTSPIRSEARPLLISGRFEFINRSDNRGKKPAQRLKETDGPVAGMPE